MKTVKEVAEILNVSKQTIHYHLKNLPPHLKISKRGNKTLIDDDIMTYLKNILYKKSTKESSKIDKQTTKEQNQHKSFYKGIYKYSKLENHKTKRQKTNKKTKKKKKKKKNYNKDNYKYKKIKNQQTNRQKSTKESSNKKDDKTNNYNSYIDKYIEHLESEIQQKNQQIADLTIALKQE